MSAVFIRYLLPTVVVLAGCTKPPTAAEIDLATCKAAILERLIDPESARFTEPFAAHTDDWRSVSFVVNAKNRMGGYAGREKYFCRFDVKSGALLSVN